MVYSPTTSLTSSFIRTLTERQPLSVSYSYSEQIILDQSRKRDLRRKQNKEFPLQPPVTICRTIDQHCKILTKVATALASSVSSKSFAFVLHTR